MGNESQLKPCPFCGGEAKLVTKNHVGGLISVYATCKNCFSKTKEMIAAADYCANDEITKIWNRRAGVAPNKAKWEICCDGYYPYCSNCRKEPQGREMTRYCPNCGAEMCNPKIPKRSKT